MSLLILVLYLVALILFAFAFFGWPASRFNLIAGGLFCWLLAALLSSGTLHG